MYSQYWGFSDTPFQSVPDPRWYFGSPGHDEALARLLFVVEQRRRLGVLTGPSGTGKSLLLELLVRQLRRSQAEVALIDLLGRSAQELLWETSAALRLGPSANAKTWDLWQRLQDHLQANQFADQPTVLLFDHADQADPECWPVLKRLFHLDSGRMRGITFLAAVDGTTSPDLRHLLRQFSDLDIELSELNRGETADYIKSLVSQVGGQASMFTNEALSRVYDVSLGNPRFINRLCDLALLGSMADGERRIGDASIDAAAEDLHLTTDALSHPRWSSRLA